MTSVLEQTYPAIEYIVIDGGSSDGSKQLIERNAARLAYWQSQPDEGFGDAIRQGFARATGTYFAYLNSDDLLAADAIERAVEYLESHPDVSMVYGNRACIDETGALLYYRPALPVLGASPYASIVIGQESCVWRRSIHEQIGGIDASYRFAIDYDLFSRLARAGRIEYVPAIWGFFRKHDESKTMTEYSTLGKAEKDRVQRETWGGLVGRPSWLAVLAVCRTYGVIGGWVVAKPTWPRALGQPRKASLQRRLEAFPRGSWMSKAGALVARLTGRR